MHPDNGLFGVEYTIAVTLAEFKEMMTEHKLTGQDLWFRWRKCLQGSRKVAWDNLLATDYTMDRLKTTDNWKAALKKWFMLITC